MAILERQDGAAPRAAPRAPFVRVVVGCVLVAAAVVMLREAVVAANEFGLDVGGPRLAPIVVASGWAVLALAYLAHQIHARHRIGLDVNGGSQSLDHAEGVEEDAAPGADWRTPVALVAALVVYALVLETVGFALATAAFFISAARILGSTRLVRDAVVGVPLAFVVYLAFTRILEIHLPEGVLGL